MLMFRPLLGRPALANTPAAASGLRMAGWLTPPAGRAQSAGLHSTAALWVRRQRGAKSRIEQRLKARGQQIPMKAFQIVRGDLVKIMAGKDKGENGIVKRVIRGENRLVVEGLNLHKKHVKKIQDDDGGVIRDGGIFEREAPLHYSNVMLCHPEDESVATRFRIGFNKDGEKVRISTVPPHVAIPKPGYAKAFRLKSEVRMHQPLRRHSWAHPTQRC